MSAKKRESGIVYLVGAGPGDPDLVTVRAKYLLDHCDVVVYDNLIPHELIQVLPAHVERRYVGKEAGRHTIPQNEINSMLVELARDGKRVVRLKGGDPFVFGRGGEEASHLKENSVRYEVVPGVTSGVAAASYAGIPCTDRRKASYVMFLTGHESVDEGSSVVPWDWVAGSRDGTLVIYMGLSGIRDIVDRLLAEGMSPDVPAAGIERGTVATQRVVTTTLSLLPEKVIEHGLKSPSLFVVGEVTRYREAIRWLESRPLFGVRVMVTREAGRAVPLYRSLRELGVEVLVCPTVVTSGEYRPEQWAALRETASGDRWLAFTDEDGVRYFVDRWLEEVGDVRGLHKYKIAACGADTVLALARYHIVPDFVSSGESAAGLADEMTGQLSLEGSTVVRVVGALEDEGVEEILQRAGAKALTLEVYRVSNVEWPAEVREKPFAFPPDVILLTGETELAGLRVNLDEGELKRLVRGATVVTVGASTTARVRSSGLKVDLEIKERSVPAVIDELMAHHRKNSLKRTT